MRRSVQKTYKSRFSSILTLLTAVISCASIAHTPHDTIDAIALGGSSENKQASLFIVRAGRHVMRSSNGGSSWKELVNGIDARYSITDLALASDFGSSKQIYLATDGDGVYVSNDAGSSWAKDNAGLDALRIRRIAIAPGNENSLLVFASATKGGLFRKDGKNRDWQQALDSSIKVTAIAFHERESGLCILLGDSKGNIWESTDRGENWRKLNAIPAAGAITSIALSAVTEDAPVIFLGTENKAVLRSLDGGVTFQAPDDWGFDRQVVAITVSPAFQRDSTLYASTWQAALIRSEDGGKTWEKHEQGLSTNRQADQSAFYSPHFRQVKIDSTSRAFYLAGFDGLFKSTDAGVTWHQLETEPVGNIWSLSLSPAIANDYVVAATTFNAGAYLARNSTLDWSINNRGLISTRLRKLVFSPNFSKDHTVFSSEDEGDYLLWSTDAGEYWNTVHLRPDWYTYWKRKILGALRYRGAPASLTTDLLTKEDKIRANPKGLVVSPDFGTDRYLYIATRYRGSFESTDAGQSLDFAAAVPFKIWNLAMSPAFATDRTLFASSREQGVYKSEDAGANWNPVNKGLEFLKTWQRQAVEDKQHMASELGRSKYYDILLAISPAFDKDNTIFTAGGEGVFKSTDGGETWKRKGQKSLAGQYVFAVALSPRYTHDKTIVVSLKGKGLFRSTDGGDTFTTIGQHLIENNHELRHVEFSPLYETDNTLYAVSLEDLFRSTDGGANWQLIQRPIRYENDIYDVISYEGDWQKISSPEFSALWSARSTSEDSAITFSFVGTGVRWIGAKSPDLGKAQVYLDGEPIAVTNQKSQDKAYSTVTYAINGLPHKPHTLMIKAMASEQPGGGADSFLVDAFDVLGNRHAITNPRFDSGKPAD